MFKKKPFYLYFQVSEKRYKRSYISSTSDSSEKVGKENVSPLKLPKISMPPTIVKSDSSDISPIEVVPTTSKDNVGEKSKTKKSSKTFKISKMTLKRALKSTTSDSSPTKK